MKRNKRLPIARSCVYHVPFVGVNTVRSIGGQRSLFVAVLDVGHAYFCIEYQLGLSQVVLCAVKKEDFPHFFNVTQDDLSETVADLKSKALERGATLEAIQLLGQLTELTKEEEIEMAKTSATKAADTTKLAKKNAPAAKEPKTAVGRVTVDFDYKTVKGAKNETREGTWAHHMIETIMGHTDSASARAANAKAKGQTPKGQNYSDKALDFAWARAQGYIAY